MFRVAVVLALLTFVVGCGSSDHPEVGTVSGTVTLDGQPLADATVLFQPTSGGRYSTGTTDASGNYSLDYVGVSGALLGTHKVMITTGIPGEDGQPPIAKERLPRKYHEKTELTAEVKSGSNTYDFKLESDKGGGKK